MLKKILTIAGSDCSGGAGIQADIKTITAHEMYAMSAITALTAQNTTGVYGIYETSPEFVGEQLDCIFKDIFPDAVKIGMVSSVEIIRMICNKLKEYNPKNIVIDPVMFSTSGHNLMNDDSMDILKTELLPLADVITPNIFEAESLSGLKIEDKEDMLNAAEEISQILECYILIKGGHLSDGADDLLYFKKDFIWFNADRINNPNNHGTGCTLSSAIACNLGNGLSMKESIKNAKAYITRALESGLDLGSGSGPLNHCV